MSVLRGGLMCVALLCLSCATTGGAGNVPRVSSPFTEADSKLFEDGVDMIGYPEGLSGKWAEDWGSDLRDRVQRSDLIALLTVNTLRTDVSPEKVSTHRLVADVSEVIKGHYEGELGLASTEGASVGFDSVDRERRKLLHQPLAVFAKWTLDDAGAVRAHWHLARATSDIVDAVRAQLGREPSEKSTIVEHTH